jgi:hypothetical protein
MENPRDWSSDTVPETGTVTIAEVVEAAKMVAESPFGGTYREWITLLQFVGSAAEHFAWSSYEAFDASESTIVDGTQLAAEYLLRLEKS